MTDLAEFDRNMSTPCDRLSPAPQRGSLPIARWLYLPEEWINYPARREKAGVPAEMWFTTKPQIAADQVRTAKASGVPVGVILADAGYSNDTTFYERFSQLGLRYAVGIQGSTSVWPPGVAPIKYILSTLPPESSLKALVSTAMMHWRIERNYQELKQGFGLDYYEGRPKHEYHASSKCCMMCSEISERVRKMKVSSYPCAQA